MIPVAAPPISLAMARTPRILDPMTRMPIARTVKHRGVVVAPRARPWRERLEVVAGLWLSRLAVRVLAVLPGAQTIRFHPAEGR